MKEEKTLPKILHGQIRAVGEQAPWMPGAPQLHVLVLGIDPNPSGWKIL